MSAFLAVLYGVKKPRGVPLRPIEDQVSDWTIKLWVNIATETRVARVRLPEPVQVLKTHVSDQGSIKAEMVENPLAGNLCFAVQRTNRIISRQINDALRSTGLTAEQIFLLAAIGEAGSPRIGGFANSWP